MAANSPPDAELVKSGGNGYNVDEQTFHVRAKGDGQVDDKGWGGSTDITTVQHGAPKLISGAQEIDAEQAPVSKSRGWFAYIQTKQFWIVLLFGYVMCLVHSPTATDDQLVKSYPSVSLARILSRHS